MLKKVLLLPLNIILYPFFVLLGIIIVVKCVLFPVSEEEEKNSSEPILDQFQKLYGSFYNRGNK